MAADGLQIRQDTAANWTSTNPVLNVGEQGFELVTGKWKWGDGVTAWNSLAYQPTVGSGTGTVTSVSVVSANGLAGSVATSTTTPAITLSTGITGVLKGNGTAISAASAGTDYWAPGGTDVAVADGGTGASSASAARTNLGLVIGTDVVAPNQDTTGKSAKTDALNSATTVVNVAAATAPSTGQVLTATDSTHATWQTPTGGSAVWGAITGTLSSQTDLNTALSGKLVAANNLTDVADLLATRWNIKIPMQARCIVVSVANQTLSGTVTIDGVALVAGNRVLLTGQTAPAENGPWVVQAGAWTRPADFPTAGVTQALVVLVVGGTVYAKTFWTMTHTGNLTIDSGSQTWAIINSSAPQTLTNKDLSSGTNTFPTLNQNTTGSAAKWTTPRLLAGNSVDGSANATFANKFIVQGTTDAGLTAAQFLGALGTGLVKNTTTTGVLSIATAGTDYVAATVGSSILKGNGAGGTTGATAGTDYTSPTGTETQTNKRKQPRVNAQASTATLTPEIDTYDVFRLTAQAAALTIANHSTSTPADGEQMRVSILDNGTARAISFGTNYVARGGTALPTTTTISKLMTLGFEWYAHLSKWVLLAAGYEA